MDFSGSVVEREFAGEAAGRRLVAGLKAESRAEDEEDKECCFHDG
jgi:hypothetical protein